MKLYSLLASLGFSLAIATAANAKIVNGTMQGYFKQVYATDLTEKHMPQYDAACKSKAWMLVNTYFYTDWRVNTDSNAHAAYFTYANLEHLMPGAYDSNKGSYVFKTEQLAQSLKDLHGQKLVFSLEPAFHYGTVQLFFEPVQVVSATTQGDDDCDCKPKPPANVSYQCVLST